MRMRPDRRMAGFTLLEAIMVIVITGILAVMMASFAKPLEGYFGAMRRADLSDVADTALRRMARELHTALPNSVRVSGQFLEFLPTITGGRYRATQNCTSTCTGDILDFTQNDTSFDVIGALPTVPAVGNELVVYNLGGSVAGADAYAGGNVAAISAAVCTSSATHVCFSANKPFPLESPASRFQIIGGPVTFACDSSTSTLWRYTGYARQASQPASIASLDGLAGVSRARLATHVNCAATNFVYAAGVTQRSGLVSMRLNLVNDSDNVTLLNQVHVPNVP